MPHERSPLRDSTKEELAELIERRNERLRAACQDALFNVVRQKEFADLHVQPIDDELRRRCRRKEAPAGRYVVFWDTGFVDGGEPDKFRLKLTKKKRIQVRLRTAQKSREGSSPRRCRVAQSHQEDRSEAE